MADVVMPRLSDSMEEGTILRWLKADGDEVSRGDELAEIETDKATMTYEADSDGVLNIVAQEGETLPIGEVIARLLAPGESPAAAVEAPAAAVASAPAPPAGGPPVSRQAEELEAARAAPAANDQTQPAAPSYVGAGNGAPSDGRIKASPLARRIARQRGVDLAAVRGTGPGGRIVRADVEAAAIGVGAGGPQSPPSTPAEPAPAPAASPPAPAAAPPPPPQPVAAEVGTAKGDVSVQDLSRVQQVVARRMAESKATIPDFTLEVEVDMEACVALRGQLKGIGGDAPVPSYNDMVVKAVALALREYPRANGSYKDGRFELYSRVNVGVAVAGQDSLIVPTVFDADSRSLGDIARTMRALAERVRSGAITPPELSGGTFTVSNLGMFGIRNFTAVINPPQAAILAVGQMAPRAVVRDGELVARNVMDMTLVSDHRILYGADAAQFLGRIREMLEQPFSLLL